MILYVVVLVPILGKIIFDLSFILMSTEENDVSTFEQFPISVMVSFRNEEDNLPNLISSLKAQNYPTDFVEFIFVNDKSTDESLTILEELNLPSNFKIIDAPENIAPGKKAALRYGLNFVQTDWVLCTDADCEPNRNWIHSMLEKAQKDVGLVLGGLFYHPGTFLQNALAAEQHALMFLTCSSAKRQQALLANGGSLLFRKELYLKSDNNLATGDDIFLLESIKQTNFKVEVQEFSFNNVVLTNAKKTIKSSLQQRLRWASKNFKISDPDMKLAGGIHLLGHISTCVVIGLIISQQAYILLIPLVIKWGIELYAIFLMDQKVKLLKSYSIAALTVVFYSWYSLLVTVLSFRGKYRWKSRLWTR